MEKPRGQLEVIARRSHCDRQHRRADPDLERLLRRQIIGETPLASVIPLDDLRRLDALRRMPHT